MAVITPRNGASLAQVVQTALNVAGREAVSIETGGSGNGVRVPDVHLPAIEAELGWTSAEQPDTTAVPEPVVPTPPPTHPTTPAGVVEAGGAGAPDPAQTQPDDSGEDTGNEAAAPEPVKTTAAKKTTASRRARRNGKEG